MGSIGADYFEGQASRRRIEELIETIQEELLSNPAVKDALTACDLQPTTRAAGLAAASAVNVILAHELGQEVARDNERDADQLAAEQELAADEQAEAKEEEQGRDPDLDEAPF